MNRFAPGTALFPLIGLLLLALAGCSAKQSESRTTTPEAAPPAAIAPSSVEENAPETDEAANRRSGCLDPAQVRRSERDRAACYRLQPATTTVVKRQVPAKSAKSAHVAKKGEKTATKAHTATETKVVRTSGRCQPQSLIYARCRTGLATCKLGDTSPVQWFACAEKNGAASSIPQAGSVLVLAANAGRGMPTGHPVYVEELTKHENGIWQLRISHTNYDRKCHLDQDATVLFDPKRMTVSFESGPWATWAKNLKALGFIQR
ncbi:MAG: hypothetical protein LBD10_08275 [Desulfobulbus sp.]|jgi:hypothetical protein|uniref:hypothetical protein n=1 Tax=Desulfobulbus sp. TaxID=895 RepID=UPI00284AF195|nr:hypothetical protein [Desulfobulbus sp.]MDR2550177.1 hypothetical protein [Desulfobulbus sp.]